jgi:integrase
MATAKNTTIPDSPPKGFTDKFLENLQKADKRYELRDLMAPGLRLRVEPSGRKTFVWYFKEGTKTKVLTIGRYGTGGISLKQARAALEKAKLRHTEGEQVQPSSEAPRTVSELAEVFYTKRILPHRKVPQAVRTILDRDILPVIGRRAPGAVTAETVAMVVEKVVDRGAVVHAGKVLAVCKQMFRYAAARWSSVVPQSPAYPLDRKDLGVQDNVRDRNLTDMEIQQLWQALDAHPRISQQVRLALKVLLLTGVRTNELLSATWDEIDLDRHEWNIPESHSKTSGWTVPLVPAVEALFLQLRDISDKAGKSPYVVAGDERTARVPGDDRPRRLSDKALARALRRLFEPRRDGTAMLAFPKCSPHDFRRTLRTHLDDLKAIDSETGRRYSIEPHIAEKCLNHSLGRIERTYNKNTLIAKRREALQAWADHVDVLVTERDNVEVLETTA